jgi:hypothetical protein
MIEAVFDVIAVFVILFEGITRGKLIKPKIKKLKIRPL